MSLDNNQLIEICAPLFGRIKNVLNKVLKDGNKSIDEIDEIILVGGSSKMPVIRKYLKYLTGMEPKIKIDPDKAIAVGAGIISGIKRREEDIKDIVLTDICPFTLGTDILNPQSNTLSFSPIIERNTSLPVSNTQIYQTVQNYQTTINIKIYQGESYSVTNNLLLGELSIKVPPAPAGMSKVSVRFTYDINGILEVEVTSLQTNETVRKVIVSNSNLTQLEIERRLTELNTIKIHPSDNNENRLILARGERLYEENYGDIREMIERQLRFFQSVLERKNILEIKKAQRSVSAFFDQLDCYESGLI
jgi:molecular chaperone HscC